MTQDSNTSLQQELDQLKGHLDSIVAEKEETAAKALRAQERANLLEAMMDIVPVGVVVSDEMGRIIAGNSVVEDMLRHPVLHSKSVEDYGEWISYHQDGRRVQAHEYPLFTVIRDGKARDELDVHYQRGDGTLFWMRILCTPMHNDEGKMIGATVALIDIDHEKKLSDQQSILIGELDHRVKNAFSVVKSIVSQSLRRAAVSMSLRKKVDARLEAYASAHAKLIGAEWDHADLGLIIKDSVSGMADLRTRLSGPRVAVPSRQAVALSMAFFELATNSVKYGAFSKAQGMVDIVWNVEDENGSRQLYLSWKERGGPAAVEPTERGYGSFIIDRALSMETGGKVRQSFNTGGYEWSLEMPLRSDVGELNE